MGLTRLSRRLRARSAIVGAVTGALVLAATLQTASAGLPPPKASSDTTDPQVAGLERAAQEAIRRGQVELAILQLKHAVVLQPRNGAVRAKLGIALMLHGEIINAESELKNARAAGAPPGVVNPALMQVMLARGEMKALLDTFPDPGPSANDANSAQILRSRGIALANLGQISDAKSSLDRALAIRRAPDVLVARADVARLDGDLPLAGKLVDEALAKSPSDVHLFLAKAELLRHHDDAKALDAVDRALAIDANFILGKIERAVILEDMHRPEQAMSELDALLARSPHLPLAVYYKAVFLSMAHRYQDAWLTAQTLPREFLQADPNRAINVAGIAAANGKMESAGAMLSELVDNHPENAAGRLKLATLRIKQGSYDLAAQILGPLVEEKNPEALALMAEASLNEGHYSDAVDFLERANAATATPNELLQRDLAVAEVNFGKPQQGIEELQKLAKTDPARVTNSGPLIEALLRAKRLDDAQTALDRFAAAAGKSAFVGFYRAQISLAKGERQEAIAAYGESIKVDPKFIPSLLYRAIVEISLGQHEAAVRDIDGVLAVDSGNPLALIQKATFLAESGQDKQAIDDLNRAIARAPKNALPRLALTNLQMARKHYDDAAMTIAQWLQAMPGDPDALSHLGQVQLARGQKKEAVATYEGLVDKYPKSSQAELLLAQAMASAGDKAGAGAAEKHALMLAPASLQVYQAVIQLQFKRGDANAAIETAKSYQSAHAGSDADLLLTDAYFRADRVADAKSTLQSITANTTDDRVISRMAKLDALQGDMQGAITLVAGALQKNGSDLALRRLYANILLQSGRNAAATAEYEAVLNREPNDAQSLNDLAWLIQDHDPSRALVLATKAVQIAPSSGEIIDTLGWIMYRHGSMKTASDLLSRAHTASPQNGEISYHQAVVLNALGRRAEAKAALQSALATGKFSDAPAAKKLMTQL